MVRKWYNWMSVTFFSLFFPMISNSQIDTENAKVIDVDINGAQGILTEKDNVIIIGWSEKNSSILLRGNLDKSTLQKVAENISKNNKKIIQKTVRKTLPRLLL